MPNRRGSVRDAWLQCCSLFRFHRFHRSHRSPPFRHYFCNMGKLGSSQLPLPQLQPLYPGSRTLNWTPSSPKMTSTGSSTSEALIQLIQLYINSYKLSEVVKSGGYRPPLVQRSLTRTQPPVNRPKRPTEKTPPVRVSECNSRVPISFTILTTREPRFISIHY